MVRRHRMADGLARQRLLDEGDDLLRESRAAVALGGFHDRQVVGEFDAEHVVSVGHVPHDVHAGSDGLPLHRRVVGLDLPVVRRQHEVGIARNRADLESRDRGLRHGPGPAPDLVPRGHFQPLGVAIAAVGVPEHDVAIDRVGLESLEPFEEVRLAVEEEAVELAARADVADRLEPSACVRALADPAQGRTAPARLEQEVLRQEPGHEALSAREVRLRDFRLRQEVDQPAVTLRAHGAREIAEASELRIGLEEEALVPGIGDVSRLHRPFAKRRLRVRALMHALVLERRGEIEGGRPSGSLGSAVRRDALLEEGRGPSLRPQQVARAPRLPGAHAREGRQEDRENAGPAEPEGSQGRHRLFHRASKRQQAVRRAADRESTQPHGRRSLGHRGRAWVALSRARSSSGV